MNLTPQKSKRKSIQCTPEKHLHDRSLTSTESSVKTSATEHLRWASTDAYPMPQEGTLRDFDLDPQFGPCCSISRKERWYRAKDLGLHPDPSILSLIERTNNLESVLDCHLRQISTSGNFR
jgi:hypothetical protein